MDLSIPTPPTIETLRARIARIEHGAVRPRGLALSLGPSIDAALPGGGLPLGALHEAAGAGPDTEHGAAAALFVAGILGRQQGAVLWVVEHADLFAPGLAGAGLHPDRVIYAEAGKPDAVLQAMEEGLRQPGLAGVVGEIGGRLEPGLDGLDVALRGRGSGSGRRHGGGRSCYRSRGGHRRRRDGLSRVIRQFDGHVVGIAIYGYSKSFNHDYF